MAFLFALPLFAETYVNGAFETSLDLNKQGEYEWKLDYPWTRVELRLFSNPFHQFEVYSKGYGNLDKSVYEGSLSSKYQLFLLGESHVRMNVEKKADIYLFMKQTRFWLGDPLFYLGNNDKDKWDYDWNTDSSHSAGFVFESGSLAKGLWLKLFQGYMYRNDIHALGGRIYKNVIPEMLSLGATGTFKTWPGGDDNYNLVYASDLSFDFMRTYLTVEAARSSTPSDTSLNDETFSWKAELRRNFNFNRMGLPIGSVNLIGSYRDVSEDFRAYLSKDFDEYRRFDQKGYFVEAKYLLPNRAVTFTYDRDAYWKQNDPYSQSYDYFEMYVEFIHDFNFKTYFQNTHLYNSDQIEVILLDGATKFVPVQDDSWKHLFFEVEMHNKTAYVKLQYKAMNLQTEYKKDVFGAEFSINITSRLKSLNRILVVDEGYRARQTFWSQLQYRFGDGVDAYFEYGNPDFVNYGLVNGGSFIDSDYAMAEKFHMYVRVGF